MEKMYITTPIYYVNDVPHIGHAYTTVAADVLSRWYRLVGKKVFFLTGTDEHGSKILEAAKMHHKEPNEYCDMIVEEFKHTWQKLNITYDHFIRTTDPQHIKAVEKFVNQLYRKGELYKSQYKGLYCIQCEKFLTETELVDGLCPDHYQKPVEHAEENYFFKLSKYRKKLIEIISSDEIKVLPEERKNEVLGKLKICLEDLSISRSKLIWGIPLPFDTLQTIYVWVDALINYISGVGYGSEKNISFWPADIHLIGKDILWFHAVIWPAMLLSLELPLPKKIFAHGFFTVNGQKMSKTIGNVIQPDELIKLFGVDATRYLILSTFPFEQDGDFSLPELKKMYNDKLANNLGNLFLRVNVMLMKYYDKKIVPPKEITFSSIIYKLEKAIKSFKEYIEQIDFYKATNVLIEMCTAANQYVEAQSPWSLANVDKEKLTSVLFDLITVLKYLTILMYPFMPITAEIFWKSLDEKQSMTEAAKQLPKITFPTGKIFHKITVTFPRI